MRKPFGRRAAIPSRRRPPGRLSGNGGRAGKLRGGCSPRREARGDRPRRGGRHGRPRRRRESGGVVVHCDPRAGGGGADGGLLLPPGAGAVGEGRAGGGGLGGHRAPPGGRVGARSAGVGGGGRPGGRSGLHADLRDPWSVFSPAACRDWGGDGEGSRGLMGGGGSAEGTSRQWNAGTENGSRRHGSALSPRCLARSPPPSS